MLEGIEYRCVRVVAGVPNGVPSHKLHADLCIAPIRARLEGFIALIQEKIPNRKQT
jgi:hypothetical protein